MPSATPADSEAQEDFFNNAPDTDRSPNRDDHAADEGEQDQHAQGGEEYVPRPKRIACILCRKRKLKCDGKRPSCGTCSRLGHDCGYDEVRKKSGPKRGYVKLLEARLKQVEDLLENRETLDSTTRQESAMPNVPPANLEGSSNVEIPFSNPENVPMTDPPFVDPTLSNMIPDFVLGGADDFSWEMIGMGLEEPLPSQDIIDDMNEIYFEKIHPSLPMIHKPRYFAAMNLAPHVRPPVALRYAVWTLACSVTPRYSALVEHFYARARKYLEIDEMRGHGETMVTLAHSQAWTLLACFEFKMMYFPRAWMSVGRADRLAQMMGLHRLDGVGLDVKQTLSPPRDWTEREERRRTFWMIFCHDRYASIGTGWPMTIDEQDIMTNLPASEEAFHSSTPESTLPLSEAMTGDGAASISAFGGVVLMACLFGRNLTHLHRPNPEDKDYDLNGEFWKRHRMLDNILLNTSLSLPSHLRLPEGLHNANIIFCNLNIHTSTICLHQAAIFKADKNRMPPQISAESKRRCIIAADQITTIMKMASHVDLSTLNPFISFCLYVAARVFVQYLRSRKGDSTVRSSLQFLLSAMQALKTRNPLTESFLVQLEVDLDGSGLDIEIPKGCFTLRVPGDQHLFADSVKCSPLYEIRQSQVQGYNGPPPNIQQQKGQPTTTAGMDFASVSTFETTTSLPQRGKSAHPNFSIDMYGEAPNWSEMDTSPDSSGGTRLSSGHPTPSSTSNKASSHTSFSPHNLGVSPNMPTSNSPNTSASHSMFQPGTPYNQFAPALGNQSADGPAGMNTPFAMPASWDYSQDGPANTGTGLQRHNPENVSESGSKELPHSTGMTPLSMPDWQGQIPELPVGEPWMYGEWPGSTPQQQ